MSTSTETHDYLRDCLCRAGDVTTRRMMGEYCVYCEGKLIGEICDGQLFLKVTETSKRLLADCPLEHPHEGAKAFLYRVDEFENVDLMRELLAGMVPELPEPKKKKRKG